MIPGADLDFGSVEERGEERMREAGPEMCYGGLQFSEGLGVEAILGVFSSRASLSCLWETRVCAEAPRQRSNPLKVIKAPPISQLLDGVAWLIAPFRFGPTCGRELLLSGTCWQGQWTSLSIPQRPGY